MTAVRSRDSWDTRTEAQQVLSVDERFYFIEAELVEYEGSAQVLYRTWKEAIQRDFT